MNMSTHEHENQNMDRNPFDRFIKPRGKDARFEKHYATLHQIYQETNISNIKFDEETKSELSVNYKGFERWYLETKSFFTDHKFGFSSPLSSNQIKKLKDIGFEATTLNSTIRPVYSLMNRIKACKQNRENARTDQRVQELIREIKHLNSAPRVAKNKIEEFEKVGFPEMKHLLVDAESSRNGPVLTEADHDTVSLEQAREPPILHLGTESQHQTEEVPTRNSSKSRATQRRGRELPTRDRLPIAESESQNLRCSRRRPHDELVVEEI